MSHASKTNMQFLETFGELEQLCNQIYGTKHGVTAYIDEMTSFNIKNGDWLYILKSLKTVRHKRNKLSHGEISFGESYAQNEDIEFLREFKISVLKQKDPIAVMYRQIKSPKNKPAKKRSKKGMVCLILILIALALILFYFFRR